MNNPPIRLAKGAHQQGPGKGEGCLMELVSFLAGEKWSDSPACTSPVIAQYGRSLNDWMDDATRQRLVPYIPRLIGTADPVLEERRMFMCADRAVRVFAPMALRALGREAEAVKLERLAPVDRETANAAAYAAANAAHAANAANAANAAHDAANAAYAAAYAAHDAANAAYAAAYAANAATWDAAIQLLDDLISLTPGSEIPDDWFCPLEKTALWKKEMVTA